MPQHRHRVVVESEKRLRLSPRRVASTEHDLLTE